LRNFTKIQLEFDIKFQIQLIDVTVSVLN